MARFSTDDEGFTVLLSLWERLGALHGDVRVSWDQLVGIEEVADVWDHLRGMRAPGTGMPGVIMLGTTRGHGRKDFCVVYGHRPGVVIDLQNHAFERILLSEPVSRDCRRAPIRL